MNQLDQIYKQIPSSTCKENCGACCGILFPSLAEIRNIKDWLGKHKREFKEFHMLVGIDCPYLGDDKHCEIYPVRPFLCRMMGVSELPCPINGCKPSKVLNGSQSGALYTAIYLKGKEKPRTEKHRKLLKSILSR